MTVSSRHVCPCGAILSVRVEYDYLSLVQTAKILNGVGVAMVAAHARLCPRDTKATTPCKSRATR